MIPISMDVFYLPLLLSPVSSFNFKINLQIPYCLCYTTHFELISILTYLNNQREFLINSLQCLLPSFPFLSLMPILETLNFEYLSHQIKTFYFMYLTACRRLIFPVFVSVFSTRIIILVTI